ncbi:MAG: prolyl-tRNA synthetase associated domain-containing protein [Clostridia bacterium]|nr:prolyl-tRNA synthetase associated domain-containing protein [Clostridia bacterium]
MILSEGRPSDLTGREEREVKVYDLLDSLGIKYAHADHEPAMTMEDCKAVDDMLDVVMCKNLFLCNRQKTSFYLLLIPGDKPFRTKEFSAALGISRVSFAEADAMEKHLGVLPGAVTVMGLMNDTEGEVQLVIDKDVISAEYIGCHPCVNTSSIKVSTTDIIEKFLPHVKHRPIYVELSGQE